MKEFARSKPQSLGDLFFSFSALSLQAFGGVLAFAEHMFVEKKRWLSREEFLEEWAIAQTMPGAPVLNLSIMMGSRHFGLAGAIAGASGILLLPLILVLLVALAYAQLGSDPHVVRALRGMGAVAAALLIATGLKLSASLKKSPLGLPLCMALGIVCFILVAVLRIPIVYVLPGLGFVGWLIAYGKVKS